MEFGESLVAIAFFCSIASIFILRGPLGRAWADRIAGRRGDGDDRALDEMREIGDRLVGDLEEIRHRLGELEERQDFAERLLTQERERNRLGAGPPAEGV